MTHIRLAALALFIPALAATACKPAEQSAQTVAETRPTEAEIRDIIQKMTDEWDAAVRAGDIEAEAATYAEDAIRMQPGVPALIGRPAIAAWLRSEADLYTFDGANTVEEVRVLGNDWAMARFSSRFTRLPKAGGPPEEFREKWLGLLQRQPDGTWKWYRDAGSADGS